MRKRMNLRGQREVSFGTFLLLILGVVGLILVIVGFTKGWGFITDIFGKTNIDITLISQKCESLASVGAAGFCSDRVEIGKDNYVNCPYAINTLGANITGTAPGCDPDAGAKAICNKLKLEEGDKYDSEKSKVNAKTCESLGVKKDAE